MDYPIDPTSVAEYPTSGSIVETGTLAFVQKFLESELCFTIRTGHGRRDEDLEVADCHDVVASQLIDRILGDDASSGLQCAQFVTAGIEAFPVGRRLPGNFETIREMII